MTPILRRSGSGLLTALLAPALAAQVPPPTVPAPGFDAEPLLVDTTSPRGFGGFAPGAPGEFYFALDHRVLLRDAHGIDHEIRSFGSGALVGLLVRPPGSPRLYYGEYATSVVWVRDLATGQESARSLPVNTYDLDVTAAGDVLVSAHPDWPRAGSRPGVFLLDPSGGSQHRRVVDLSGASGPLVVERPTGDLLYATQTAAWPSPPGSVRLLRFPAARLRTALAGGPALAESDGVEIARLDGAFDLACDDRGAIYVSDPQHGDVRRVAPDGRLDPTPLLPRAARGTLGLVFVDGSDATFDAWQPEAGGALWVGTSDWLSFSAIHAVRPARPEVTATPPDPTGPFRVAASGLPASAPAWFLVNDRPPLPVERIVVSIGGVPVWSAFDFAVPAIAGPLALDAEGDGFLDVPYGGGLSWTLSFQAVALTPAGGLATSPVTAVRLRP